MATEATVGKHDIPHSTLTDHGIVFTTRFAGGKGGGKRTQLGAVATVPALPVE
ncbi:hypothetical protein [Mycobacterium simiae]|uniref:hypothetical protein n=1 Tax=Mycobacterium simiae TaxID=1784 RepID=UPI001592D8DA|nr:hypothetical protein [Mycobacterium simiae]